MKTDDIELLKEEIDRLEGDLKHHEAFFQIMAEITTNRQEPGGFYEQVQLLLAGMDYYHENL